MPFTRIYADFGPSYCWGRSLHEPRGRNIGWGLKPLVLYQVGAYGRCVTAERPGLNLRVLEIAKATP